MTGAAKAYAVSEDATKEGGRYAKGTIAWLNGGQYARALGGAQALPEGITAEDVKKWQDYADSTGQNVVDVIAKAKGISLEKSAE